MSEAMSYPVHTLDPGDRRFRGNGSAITETRDRLTGESGRACHERFHHPVVTARVESGATQPETLRHVMSLGVRKLADCNGVMVLEPANARVHGALRLQVLQCFYDSLLAEDAFECCQDWIGILDPGLSAVLSRDISRTVA